MKKFKITYTTTREFEVPDNCSDEQYDELKAVCLLGLTKEPIKPGEKGAIDVTYNGTDKFPGHFQKTITIRSNAVNEVVRLTIEGNME